MLKNVSASFLQSKKIQVRKLIKKIESLVRKKSGPEKTVDFDIVPLTGMRQVSKSDGYWDDSWIRPRFVAMLKPGQEFQ